MRVSIAPAAADRFHDKERLPIANTATPMPALPKASYETVAQALAAGKTQREAYLAAGYSYRPANAHRLCTSPAIASRVTEIAAQRYEDERKTREIAANEAGLD